MKLLHYLKFFLFHVIGIISAVFLLGGGHFITLGFALVVFFYMFGDAYAGDDTSMPDYKMPQVLTVQLWMALPLLAWIVFSAIWSAIDSDPFGYGAWITQLTGYDVLAARANNGPIQYVASILLTGLMIGLIGTITAHELTHRTWDKISMLVGRWLLAFSFDTIFAIEHVYGHHHYVATRQDPATAPRGRNVYYHILASTIKGNISAWKIEKARLQRTKKFVFSWHNAFLRGHAMSLLLVLGAYAMGGMAGMLFFIACALWGKALLEIVNYMEHYGLVRNPNEPVQPRHSWNTNKRISSWSMFNLTRHSHHHAQGEVPYHKLRPFPDAPMMIGGYLTTIIVAMIPPLWHHKMTPKVLEWDKEYASADELELAREDSLRSGKKAFIEAYQ